MDDGVPSWEPWTWDEKNAVQKDGKLILIMTYEPHTRKNGQSPSQKSGSFRSKLKRTTFVCGSGIESSQRKISAGRTCSANRVTNCRSHILPVA